MPIALVLDTNVLRQEGLTSRNMHILMRLAASSEVEIYVPEICAREFKSQRILEVKTQVEKCITAMNEMSRQVDAKGPTHAELALLKSRMTTLGEGALGEVETNFSEWLKASNARLIAFDPLVMSSVLDDYFVGAGAFRKPKCRDDIPDAIVSAGIRSLLQTHDAIHVAVKDAVLKRHLEVEPRYTVIDGLTEFFSLEPVAAVRTALDAREKNVAVLIELLGSGKVRERLTAYLKGAKGLLEDVYIEEDDLSGLEILGEGIWGATLNYAQAQSIDEIEYGDVTFIGPGQYSLELIIHTRARIDYCADFVAVLDLPDSRRVEQVSMDGDGVCNFQEERDVALKGYLQLSFDPTLPYDAVDVHTQYLDAEKPQISIELEVMQAGVA